MIVQACGQVFFAPHWAGLPMHPEKPREAGMHEPTGGAGTICSLVATGQKSTTTGGVPTANVLQDVWRQGAVAGQGAGGPGAMQFGILAPPWVAFRSEADSGRTSPPGGAPKATRAPPTARTAVETAKNL